MQWSKALIALMAFAMSSHDAQAQVSKDTFIAADLYAACTHSVKDANTQKDHEYIEQLCTNYLRGLRDALFVMQILADRGTHTCLPENEAIDVQEARVVFEEWLRTHPNSAANSAGLVATMALVYAHKCGGSN